MMVRGLSTSSSSSLPSSTSMTPSRQEIDHPTSSSSSFTSPTMTSSTVSSDSVARSARGDPCGIDPYPVPVSSKHVENEIQNIFYSITSEYNSTFVFLVLCLHFGILEMTEVHLRSEVYFSSFFSCFINHVGFVSDSCFVPRRNLFKFLTFLKNCCFCCGYLHYLRHRRINLCTKL